MPLHQRPHDRECDGNLAQKGARTLSQNLKKKAGVTRRQPLVCSVSFCTLANK